MGSVACRRSGRRRLQALVRVEDGVGRRADGAGLHGHRIGLRQHRGERVARLGGGLDGVLGPGECGGDVAVADGPLARQAGRGRRGRGRLAGGQVGQQRLRAVVLALPARGLAQRAERVAGEVVVVAGGGLVGQRGGRRRGRLLLLLLRREQGRRIERRPGLGGLAVLVRLAVRRGIGVGLAVLVALGLLRGLRLGLRVDRLGILAGRGLRLQQLRREAAALAFLGAERGPGLAGGVRGMRVRGVRRRMRGVDAGMGAGLQGHGVARGRI